jgi:hypothetical protein
MGSVHEAILKVTDEIGSFQKDLPVEDVRASRSYNVVSFDTIVQRVQPLLVSHKLCIVREKTVSESWERESPRTHFSKVTATYALTGPGGDTIYAESVGESESPNDKSMSAALSFAEKYLYKDLFKIVVGDPDPDSVGGGIVRSENTSSRSTAAPTVPVPVPTTTTPQPNSSSTVTSGIEQLAAMSEPPPAPVPQTQPALENAVQRQQPTGEAVSEKQAQLISVILTGKKNPDFPNNQGMTQGQAYDFVEGVVGRALDRSVHYTKKFLELTKDEAKKVMDAIKHIPGVSLPDRPRQ